MDLFKILLLGINLGVFATQTTPTPSPALLIPVSHLEEYIKAEVTRQVSQISKDVINQAVEEKIREVNKGVIMQEVKKQIMHHATNGTVNLFIYFKLKS